MSHTPGPWKIGKPANRDPKVISIRSDVIEGTIYTWVAQAMRWDRAIPEEEWKANARLIAAAPDLLEACKLFEKYGDNSTMEDPPEHPTLGEVTEAILTAIAKAEGK